MSNIMWFLNLDGLASCEHVLVSQSAHFLYNFGIRMGQIFGLVGTLPHFQRKNPRDRKSQGYVYVKEDYQSTM